MQILITFDNPFDATFCAKVLRQSGISCYSMPIPRTLSASCGVCIVTDDSKGCDIIKEHPEIVHRGVYKVLNGEYQPLK